MASGGIPRQGDLFANAPGATSGMDGAAAPDALPLQAHQLRDWQERLQRFQAPRFEAVACGAALSAGQIDLFSGAALGPAATVQRLDPLALAARHLQFWRWPESGPNEAALYFVLDRPPHLEGHLLLYVGETAQADQRWKGEHDCKTYLAAYGEALQQAELGSGLSIRFWRDAPVEVKARRALEQALIRHWLPPFNKETRGRWATPFTAEPG
ncbi:MAG: GIY-YIG nuclease family protein [Vulcanococcus sp.]